VSAKPVLLLLIGITLFSAGGNRGICQTVGDAALMPRQSAPTLAQPSHPEDAWRTKMEQDMAKKAIEERHAALKRDTDRLLKLSTELKAYVDKANQHTLSLEVVKKAEEIEKLAHSVKEKMKGN
jgi:hypothetical protein